MRRRIEMLAAVVSAVLLTCTLFGQETGRSASVALQGDQDAGEVEHPEVRRILRWNDKIIGVGNVAFEIDIERRTAKPLRLEDGSEVLSVATFEVTRHAALVKEGVTRKLVELKGKQILALDAPDAVRESVGRIAMAGDETGLVLVCCRNKIFRREQEKWRNFEFQVPSEWMAPRAPFQLEVRGGAAYLGYDHGEWGGGLVRFDFASATQTSDCSDTPCTGIRCAPDGKVWATYGLAHLDMVRGEVRAFDGREWSRVIETKRAVKLPGPTQRAPAAQAVKESDWPFGDAVVSGIDFDISRRACLLTREYGIVRLDAGKWTWISRGKATSRGWHKSDLLMLSDDLAIIALRGSGVLVCDLKTQAVTQIPLTK